MTEREPRLTSDYDPSLPAISVVSGIYQTLITNEPGRGHINSLAEAERRAAQFLVNIGSMADETDTVDLSTFPIV